MSTLYLCGAGNLEGIRLALTVNRRQRRWDRITLLDDDATKHGRSVLGVEIAGPFDLLERSAAETAEVCNLVTRTTRGRRAARDRIERYGLPFATLISPDVDTTGVECAGDVTVYQHATLGPCVFLDEGTVVLIGGVVGHGSRVDRGCVVAPNAVLNARVELGEGVYAGTNASILPEVKVGAWATIGAGAVVVQDVPAGATVMSVPGQVVMLHPAAPRVAPVEPRTPVEAILARIWAEAIGGKPPGIHDNFFEAGGTLRSMMQIAAAIESEFQVTAALQSLLDHPTIAEVAGIIEAQIIEHADRRRLEETLQEIENMPDGESSSFAGGISTAPDDRRDGVDSPYSGRGLIQVQARAALRDGKP